MSEQLRQQHGKDAHEAQRQHKKEPQQPKVRSFLGKFVRQKPIAEEKAAEIIVNAKALAMQEAFAKILKLRDYYSPEKLFVGGTAGALFTDVLTGFSSGKTELRKPEPETVVQKLVAGISAMDYTASDISEFALLMKKFQREKNFADRAGLFLSDLMNACKEENFEISVLHLDVRMNYLGYRNTKSVRVRGDLGDNSARGMTAGRFMLEGSCGSFTAAELHGGVVSVEGSVLDFTGERMDNGMVNVALHARDYSGDRMKGGNLSIGRNARDNTGSNATSGQINVGWNVRDYTGIGKGGGCFIFVQGHDRQHTHPGVSVKRQGMFPQEWLG